MDPSAQLRRMSRALITLIVVAMAFAPVAEGSLAKAAAHSVHVSKKKAKPKKKTSKRCRKTAKKRARSTKPKCPKQPRGGKPTPPRSSGTRPGTQPDASAGASADRLFAPDSIWNRALGAGEPLDPNSAAMVGAFNVEVQRELKVGSGPWIQTSSTGVPIYRVGPATPTVTVTLDPGLSQAWRIPLQAAFNAVPIPANAAPAQGSDGHLVIWQPSTDKMWEFWKASKDASGGWHARWGGAMDNVSRNGGYYSPAAWPGGQAIWGASGTSLPIAAGVITLDELKRGQIDHALALNLPYPRAGVWAWPAQRADGTGTDPAAIPEGAHLRLDPNLDLSKLKMPKLVRMMAEAAQKYGMVVRDQTHSNIGFFIEDPTPTNSRGLFYQDTPTVRPAPNGYFEGYWPSTLMRFFPWSSVEVLKMDLRNSKGPVTAPKIASQSSGAR